MTHCCPVMPTQLACHIQAQHRWVVSGTPLRSVDDIGCLFRILHAEPWGRFNVWKNVLRPLLHPSVVSPAAGGAVGLPLLYGIMFPITYRASIEEVLRRGEVPPLPPIHELAVGIGQSSIEAEVYRQLVALAEQALTVKQRQSLTPSRIASRGRVIQWQKADRLISVVATTTKKCADAAEDALMVAATGHAGVNSPGQQVYPEGDGCETPEQRSSNSAASSSLRNMVVPDFDVVMRALRQAWCVCILTGPSIALRRAEHLSQIRPFLLLRAH